METKKFIYAVIDNMPLPDGQLRNFPIDGIAAAPLKAVCYRDIAAVISPIDEDRFVLPDQDQLNSDLLKHQRVNSLLLAMSGQCGVLPLKFGFTAADDTDVEAVLERAYLQLRSHLDRLNGQVEMVIQASWDLPKIITAIAHEHPEYICVELVQTGKLLFEAAEAKRKDFIEDIHGNLFPLAREFSDGQRKTESMILNRSYLVNKKNEAQFDDAMNTLGDRYDAVLSLRYIGPIPAYSFVNIELNQGNFALLDQARKILQLPEYASWGQIKSAYRQLLMTFHPDHNQGDQHAAKSCREVVASFGLVSAYCQSFPDFTTQGNDGEYSFTRNEVENAFIVETKGAASSRVAP